MVLSGISQLSVVLGTFNAVHHRDWSTSYTALGEDWAGVAATAAIAAAAAIAATAATVS